jgi:hypothetical protein
MHIDKFGLYWLGWPDAFMKQSPKIEAKTLLTKIFSEKSSRIIYDTYIIFKNLPKIPNHPIGENSPNLVTFVLNYPQRRATSPFGFCMTEDQPLKCINPRCWNFGTTPQLVILLASSSTTLQLLQCVENSIQGSWGLLTGSSLPPMQCRMYLSWKSDLCLT